MWHSFVTDMYNCALISHLVKLTQNIQIDFEPVKIQHGKSADFKHCKK